MGSAVAVTRSPLASLAHGRGSLVRALVLAGPRRRRPRRCAPPSTRCCATTRRSPGRTSTRWLAADTRASTAHRFFHWPLEFADVFYDESGRVPERAGLRRRDRQSAVGNAAARSERRTERANPEPRNLGTAEPRPDALRPRLRPLPERAIAATSTCTSPFSSARSRSRSPADASAWCCRGASRPTTARRIFGRRLLDRSTLDTIVGLDNADAIFPIHRGLRFVVVVAGAGGRTREVRARFGIRTTAELDALPARDDPAASAYPIRLTPAQLALVGGRTRRIPDARSTTGPRPARRMSPALSAARQSRGVESPVRTRAQRDRRSRGRSARPACRRSRASTSRRSLAVVDRRPGCT